MHFSFKGSDSPARSGQRVVRGVLALAALLLVLIAPSTWAQGAGYWHTSGNKILDSSGNEVRIAGINWYGAETPDYLVHGLWAQDFHTVLNSIKSLGYNVIRIPFSNQLVESNPVPTNYSNYVNGPVNQALVGQTALADLDTIIAYAGSIGLRVILDNHRSEAGETNEANGLWYTSAYPQANWIADWQTMATRYSASKFTFNGNPTVIGMDLRNEPHLSGSGSTTGSCWTGDTATNGCPTSLTAQNWPVAAQAAGNAILAINPKLLIFVEGNDCYSGVCGWQGGNLIGVANNPVKLNVANQLVYSAHDYGPNLYQQPWFNGSTTTASLDAIWNKYWGYISANDIAPVWLGEFGTDNSNSDLESTAAGSQGQWFQSLVGYLQNNSTINWTYWALNGEDIYGLLDGSYDATPPSSLKQSLLASIQFPLGGNPSPSFTLSSSPSTISVAQGSSATDTISVTPEAGFTGSVSFTASGMPSGVTASFSPTSSTTSSVLTLMASSTATTGGPVTVTITGTSGSATASTTVALTVSSGSCTPTTIVPYISVNGGSSWTEESSATVSSTSAAVDLGPQPLTGTWSWTGPNGYASTSRQINSIPLSTGVNNYVATYTNTSSCKSTQAFAITVTGSSSGFSLTPSASTLSVQQGTSGTDTIAVADTGGFTGSVAFTVSGLPSGVTASFSPTSSTSSSVLTLTASSTAAASGPVTVTVTGTSGSTTASATISVTVTAAATGSFTLKASAATLSIAQGASGTDSITVTDVSPFSGSVSFAASGLPSGVTASFSPASSTSSSVLTLTASSTATTGGPVTVTITGTSGSLSASTTIALTISAGTSGFACHIGYTISSQWQGGFGAAITINNTGTTAISNWTLTWTFANGQIITQLWNGSETQSGANVTVTNLSYNGSIPAGGSYTGMGFNGSWNNTTNSVPASFAVNGTTCK